MDASIVRYRTLACVESCIARIDKLPEYTIAGDSLLQAAALVQRVLRQHDLVQGTVIVESPEPHKHQQTPGPQFGLFSN